MPHFITIGYGDEDGYLATGQPLRDAAHAHDARLVAEGAIVGVAESPVQVRNHGDLGVELIGGSFMRSDLPVAGFSLIEAATLEDAVALAAMTPCAVARGIVEVWPLSTIP